MAPKRGIKRAERTPEMIAMLEIKEEGLKPYTLSSQSSSTSSSSSFKQPACSEARKMKLDARKMLDMTTAPRAIPSFKEDASH
jgi:hypothetical protein